MPAATLTMRPSPARTASGGSVAREGASTGRRPSSSDRSAIAVERSATRVERCPEGTEENVATASTRVAPAVAGEAIVDHSATRWAAYRPAPAAHRPEGPRSAHAQHFPHRVLEGA